MNVRIYVPRDTSANACGADEVAAAIDEHAQARGIAIELVRNGSRGMCWLEPLVEVESERGRIGFGPLTVESVAGLFDAGFPNADTHALCLGPVEDIDWLKQQQRVCFSRNGIIDPISLDDFEAHGGWQGARRALAMTPQDIVSAVTESGLRGRGGAAFPAHIKWQTVHDAVSDTKYVVCNADEGDSGTFADRLLMEADPFQLIEGMAIAALAVGATRGFVYIRSEYPHAVRTMERAVEIARAHGVLGARVLGSAHAFDLSVRMGAGAYICGEETAMLESLEGKRGIVRSKPPIPALSGLFGKPTVIHNVLSLAAVSDMLAKGGAHYASLRGSLQGHHAVSDHRQREARRHHRAALWRDLARTAGAVRRWDSTAGNRCARCRWAGRWVRTCQSHSGTPTRLRSRLPASVPCWATAELWYSMIRSTWVNKHGLRWRFVHTNRVASARRAASARRVAVEVIDRLRVGKENAKNWQLLDEPV
jgi:hypothetical protein